MTNPSRTVGPTGLLRWLFRIAAHPPLEVSIARTRFVPVVDVLDAVAPAALLEDYRRRRPRQARWLFPLTGTEVRDATTAAEAATHVKVARFRPATDPFAGS